MMSRAFASLMAAAVAFVAGTAQATTYNWNIATDGTWDTTSANWAGGSGMWVDGTGNSAVFSNTNLPLRITVSGARAMGSLRVGNAANYGNYSFDGTGGGSLTVNNDAVFSDNNGTVSPVCLLTNLTMSVSGNLKVGRSSLVIGGTSAVTVSGQINAPDDWGYVTIKDSATVIASNGVDCLSKVWGVKLDGGTLITKYIKTSAWAMDGTHDPTLYLNGTTMKAMLSTNTFLTEGYANKGYINAGGAIFDTDGYNIGVGVNMVSNSPSGGLTKLGAGSLTIFGTNTYAGVTAINGGTLVFSNATAFGNGGNITFGGGTLKYGTGFTTDLSARIKNSTGAVSIDNNGQDIILAQALDSSNVGGLAKTGAGKLTLSGVSAYAGVTTVNGGTLTFASSVGGIGTAAYATNNSYTFTPAGGNLLAGLSPSFTNNTQAGKEGTGSNTLLTDGNVAASYTVGNDWNGNYAVLTYTVGSTNAGCAITGINLYTGPWPGGGREDITISNIMYSTVSAPTTFIVITNSSLNYSVASGSGGFASLTASGGLLASDVYAIKFNFGPQENYYVGYRELEVIGVRAASLQNSTNVNLAASGAVLDLTHQNCLSTNTVVRLVTGSCIQLDNAGTNTIAELYINGKAQYKGLYSTNNLPAYLSGPGNLLVTSSSAPKRGTLVTFL
jgi:autotransporter-associated beta strand protein